MKLVGGALIEKGISKPPNKINKDKNNLVAGTITQPFAEMVWVMAGGVFSIAAKKL